jgi:hypothetical protein
MEPEFMSMAEQRRHEYMLKERNALLEEQMLALLQEDEGEPRIVDARPPKTLQARFQIDVHTNGNPDDYKYMQTMDRLEDIDFQSLILSRFEPQEIAEYGISVTVRA